MIFWFLHLFQAVNQKSVSDAEKREKLIVIRKLEGLEKELKVVWFQAGDQAQPSDISAPGVFWESDGPGIRGLGILFSISCLQTLDQLRLENNRLREENLALLRVMDKIVKN